MNRIASTLRTIYLMAAPFARTPHRWPQEWTWRRPTTISNGTYVFVQGTPRSGTTLLQTILGSHSQLENQHRETGLFTLQSIFGRRHFELNDSDLKHLFRTTRDLVDFFDHGVASVLTETEHRFVEKTPQHILRLPMLVRHFPDSQFIHVVRDGRDCYCSARHVPGIPQRFNARVFAWYWRRCLRARRQVGHANNVYDLHYERLVTEPEQELRNLMAFLGLDLEPAQLDATVYGRDQRVAHDHHRNIAQPIEASSVERWKRELSERDQRTFLRICRKELEAFGYETV